MNFVNAYQSKEERATKYHTCREEGIPAVFARRYRDLTWPHFALALDCYSKLIRERQEQVPKQ